jgi:transposase
LKITILVGEILASSMTGWGEKIDDIPEQDLKARVDVHRTSKPVWRLVAAIEYKHGVKPAAFEAKYGIPRDTVYSWLDRFEERGVDRALEDEPIPGPPSRLAGDERRRFFDDLRSPPDRLGYDTRTWDPPLVRRHLEAEYGVEYSLRHVMRLLDDAGM